ncbi:MAG TPA: hypothetical protein VIQ22_02570, partial [Gammaproteobacteria bacterium]
LVNPYTIVSGAVMGGVAALTQWATSSLSAATGTNAATEAMERQKAILESLAEASETLRLETAMMTSGAETIAEQKALDEILRLTEERAEIVRQLGEDYKKMGRAAGIGAQIVADSNRQALLSEIALYDAALKTLEAKRETKAAAEAHDRMMVNLYGTYAKTRGEADKLADEAVRAGLAASNLSLVDFGNIDAGAAAALRMAGNLGIAYNAAVALGGVFSRLTAGDDERGSQRETVAGANTRKPDQPWLKTYDRGGWMTIPGVKGGAGGAGGSRSQAATEAEKEAEAIQKVIEGLQAEIGLIGATTEARRLQQELQKAGVTIYSEEGQAIAALVEDLMQLEAQQKLVEETMQGIEDAAQGFFVGVLSGAKSAKEAIGDLLKSLGDLFLNQAFKMLWGGASAGGKGGGLQSLFFDAGGRIPAGALGIVGEKRPEFVDGQLVTRPTLIEGPANVTGGAATAKMLNTAPAMQVAMRRPSQAVGQPKVNVQASPVIVKVINDPRQIDAFLRSPEGERASARTQRRLGNG